VSSRGPRVATTAADFFGNNTNASKKNITDTTSPNTTTLDDGKSNKTSANMNVTSKNKLGFSTKETVSTTSTTKRALTEYDKENGKENNKSKQQQKQSASYLDKKNIGNADDFVGDVDDDDDEEEVRIDISQSNHHKAVPEAMDIDDEHKHTQSGNEHRNDNVDNDLMDDDEDDNNKTSQNKTGAMDAFVVANKETTVINNNSNATHSRRRRKKLVERTYTDAKGYLHTETQEIWEEIPSDEENDNSSTLPTIGQSNNENGHNTTKKSQQLIKGKASDKGTKLLPNSKNSKKGTAASHLKQGSLMGFFSKK
jgi:hypothetical protein